MNIFIDYLKKIKKSLKNLEKNKLIILPKDLENLTVELPPKELEGDISCNAALILSKINKKSPSDLAELLKKQLLKDFSEFEKILVVKPGFINIILKDIFWKKFLEKLLKLKGKYGSSDNEKNKYNVEFVSANPTGPLHVGHCRGAILGDVISNLLIFNGNKVTKEYYVNDYGGQIKKFTYSVYLRIIEILRREEFPISNEDLYPGEYIIDIAKNILKKKYIRNFDNFESIHKKLQNLSINESIKLIKNNLSTIGIVHNKFIFESKLVKEKAVAKTIEKLKRKNFIYEGKIKAPESENENQWIERKQLLFKSTSFEDDKDRPLQKNDSTWTYFAGDLAYHDNKISRKYDVLINILGADHAGYVNRIKAGVEALSNKKIKLNCKVCQLVKLLKNGEPYKMSKRRGDYITVDDLINEVGKDAVRFMMLSRSNDVELDFDFKKVTEKSKDNPVYYVQYCYARICSIFRNLNIKKNNNFKIDNKFKINTQERQIIKKLSEWPKCVYISSKKMEPHRIPTYLYELATLFHSYWNLGKDNVEFRFITDDKPTSLTKLVILKSLSNVIECGMSIIGVSTPNKM